MYPYNYGHSAIIAISLSQQHMAQCKNENIKVDIATLFIIQVPSYLRYGNNYATKIRMLLLLC